MACRGVLFALTDEQAQRLLSAADQGDEQVEAVMEEIDALWEEAFLQETEKEWDALHRCLSDGTLNLAGGTRPLNQTILGGQQLYAGQDYIVAFVSKIEVKYVTSALKAVTESWFRTRFFALRETEFPQQYVTEEYAQIDWDYFQAIREFYQKAAQADRAVVFTADQ